MTNPVVTVEGVGRLEGRERRGVQAFLGVPYAAPPVGPLRFAPPAPPLAWSGVRDAGAYGPSCPQPNTRPKGWPQEEREGEDCLVLNVWTPATGEGRRPVMVFLHGGGYAIGSGSWPLYEGVNLARRGDAVVVTVNHRLGPLGYLHLAAFDDALKTSGSVGMLDLVAALRWVGDHIGAFGGDAANVTVFGESGGGAKVCSLMAMPQAKGLFHRAIVQSGPGRHVRPPDQAHGATLGLLERLDIAPGADAVAKLRALPVEDIIRVVGRAGEMARTARMGFVPVMDGEAITAHPVDAVRDGWAPEVPLLIGTTFDEATLGLAAHPALRDPSKLSWEELAERLEPLWRPGAAAACRLPGEPASCDAHRHSHRDPE